MVMFIDRYRRLDIQLVDMENPLSAVKMTKRFPSDALTFRSYPFRIIFIRFEKSFSWASVFGSVLMFKPVTYTREFFCGEVSRPLSRKVRPTTIGIYNEWGRDVFEVRFRGVRNQGSLCFFGKVFAV